MVLPSAGLMINVVIYCGCMCNQRHVANGLLLTNKWFKWRDFLPISKHNILAGSMHLDLYVAVVVAVAFKFEFGNLNRISAVPSAKANEKSEKKKNSLADDREIHAISRMRFSRVVAAS